MKATSFYLKKTQSGQALTSLIIVMFVGLSVIATTVAIVDTNSLVSYQVSESQNALVIAESSLEDALITLLRNPNYSGGTLTTSEGTATITLTPGVPVVITSKGEVGRHVRTVQATIVFTNGVMSVQSWKEI